MMGKSGWILPVVMVAMLVSGCSSVDGGSAHSCSSETPRNIILFIGDGLGPAQLTAATFLREEMHIARMPVGGFIRTSSTSRITDSAAGATALATGRITDNGRLSVSPDGVPHRMVTHVARDAGKRTGIVSTSRVVHATPAAFSISHENRRAEHEIAARFVEAPLDVILSAGWNQFLPTGSGGERDDDRNVVEEMEARGFTYFDAYDQLAETEHADRVLGLFVAENFDAYPQRGEVTSELTQSAIANLGRGDEGFFLMVEGSQIDWAGHDNQAEWMGREVLDFDNAVGVALDFAQRDGCTLVIVTGDHETGGYTLTRDSAESSGHIDDFSTGYHTATAIPIFAYGPSAERFGGLMHQKRVGQLMFELLGERHPDFQPGPAD